MSGYSSIDPSTNGTTRGHDPGAVAAIRAVVEVAQEVLRMAAAAVMARARVCVGGAAADLREEGRSRQTHCERIRVRVRG